MKTVEEVRVVRLKQLIEENGGSPQKVADLMGRPVSQICSLRDMTLRKSGPDGEERPRIIGSELAREFEKYFKKPRGWMDTDPRLLAGKADEHAEIWRRFAMKLAERCRENNIRVDAIEFLGQVDEMANKLEGANKIADKAAAYYEEYVMGVIAQKVLKKSDEVLQKSDG